MSILFSSLPRAVRIVEVGPRDGLQNESITLATDVKVAYIEMLAEAGFQEIEVSSFVNPKRIPQLADAAELFAELAPHANLRYTALVPNLKGLERALEAGVRSIALFTAASETFTHKNIGMGIAESLQTFRTLMPPAKEHGLRVRAYVSTAFVCPYEGVITPAQVIPVVEALRDMGVDEISVGDTIGHATPDQVALLIESLLPLYPRERTAYHFHDTRGMALVNVLTALQYGISIFDSASGGVGGCPYAPGAAGNLATEDLCLLLDGMGIESGVNVARVADASRFLATQLGRQLPGRALQSLPLTKFC